MFIMVQLTFFILIYYYSYCIITLIASNGPAKSFEPLKEVIVHFRCHEKRNKYEQENGITKEIVRHTEVS